MACRRLADVDHAIDFWRSVAQRFLGDRAVLFDLYKEPHDITDACWRDGCVADGWQPAGTRQLLDTIRSAGATQPILITCNGWEKVPVVTGEFGDTDCNHDFTDQYMAWADAHDISYLAWGWYQADCAGFPSLITDWNGTPAAYGVGLRNRLWGQATQHGHRHHVATTSAASDG